MWPLFRLHVGLGHILPHDAEAEELDAADKDDDTDRGGPASYRISEHQPSDNDENQKDKASITNLMG